MHNKPGVVWTWTSYYGSTLIKTACAKFRGNGSFICDPATCGGSSRNITAIHHDAVQRLHCCIEAPPETTALLHYRLAKLSRMESDPAWIEDLLKTNYAPSHEAAQEVKRMMLKPLKDLEHLDAEILELRNHLSELETKRDETKKRISRYKPILAPIRRVPPDVLGEIFSRCLTTHRNPIMKSSECPLLLTQVCSTWRVTAMTTPQLWERLYITFSDEDTVPDVETAAEMARNRQLVDAGWRTARPRAIKKERTALLNRRFEAIRDWFSRSGSRPLSISMSFTATSWYTVPYSDRPRSATTEFLCLLATLAPRLKEFEVKTSITLYQALEDILEVSQMTALTSFRAEYTSQFPETTESTRPIKVLGAPNLRQVSMTANDTRIWGLAYRSITQWNKLTNITCFNSLTIAETISLLENAHSLVHYRGVISEYIVDNTPTAYEGHISLPFLESFTVTEYINPVRMGNVYDRIDAPALQWVKYSSQLYPGEFTVDNPAPIAILPLLRKSTQLQKLSVDTNDFTTWDVVTLLRAVPSITNLVLGLEERLPLGTLARTSSFIGYDASGVLNRELWSLKDLVVDNPSEVDEIGPLLPRLTSLIVSSLTVRMTDEIIFDLIKSRMIPRGALEHVKVVFYKEKDRDIRRELTRFAKDVGVKINLHFQYAQPAAPDLLPTSPEFGLRGPNGRSWPYADAGENLLYNSRSTLNDSDDDEL